MSSLVIGIVSFFVTGSAWFCVAVVLSGIFIDVDHWIEYWTDRGIHFRVKEFFRYSAEGEFTYYILLFHSIELVFVFCCLGFYYGLTSVYAAVALGLGSHIVLDYINIMLNFGFKPRAVMLYSLIYRVAYGFSRLRMDRQLKYRAT